MIFPFASFVGANFNDVGAVTLKITTVGSAAPFNITTAITSCYQDHSDAPDTYGTTLGGSGPFHIPSANLYLGAVQPDVESDGLPGGDATGDNLDNINDEDGLVSLTATGSGASYTMTANVKVSIASGTAMLCGWIDTTNETVFYDVGLGGTKNVCATVDSANGTVQTIALSGFQGFVVGASTKTYARFRVCTNANHECDTPYGFAPDGEVEDYAFTYNTNTTSAVIGKVEIDSLTSDAALSSLLGAADPTDAAALWALLNGLDPELAAMLRDADAATLQAALLRLLDPNHDGVVALLRWETLAENGTIGFDVERRQRDGDWQRFNDPLLPGLIVASAGGDYALLDPAAVPGQTLEYRIVEQEAGGNRNTYGPYTLTMAAAGGSASAASIRAALAAKRVSGRPNQASGTAPTEWHGLGQGYMGHIREANAPHGASRHGAPRHGRPAHTSAQSTPANWLYTAGTGLYQLTATEIAGLTGNPVRQVQQMLKTGNAFALSHDGAPAPWCYDAAADALLFSALDFRDLYSDQDAFRLFSDHLEARTMGVNKAAAPRAGVPGEVATARVHLGKDVYARPDLIRGDVNANYWFQDYLYPNLASKASLQLPLVLPGLAPAAGTASLDIHLHGMTDVLPGNDHKVTASLGGAVLGSAEWDGSAPATLSVQLSSAQLALVASGTPLVLKSANLNSIQWYQSIDATYPRTLRADSGQLLVQGLTAGQHTVSGFAGPDIRVVEAPGTTAATWYANRTIVQGADGWQVSFKAPHAADFLIIDGSTIKAPAAIVAEDATAPLRDPKRQSDYLIIAPKELGQTAAALQTLRAGQFKRVDIAWLPDIEQEFGNGRPGIDAVDGFLEYVATKWRRAPDTVVLLGRGTTDPRDLLGFGNSLIPVPMVLTPWGLLPSDYRYAESVGAIRFALGRIPVIDETEGLAYVAKLQAAEAVSLGSAANTAVVVADNPDKGGDFHLNADLLTTELQGGGYTVRRFYRCLAGELHPACANVRAALTQSSTWMTPLLSYEGHSSLTQLGGSGENFLLNTDVAGLSNSVQPIFTAMTCLVGGNFSPQYRSLAETLVLRPGGGAIAALAPSGQSVDGDASVLGLRFADSLVAGATLGEATRDALNASRGQITPFIGQIYQVTGDPAVRLP